MNLYEMRKMISKEDFDFIAERTNTRPSGLVWFPTSAINRFRKAVPSENMKELWEIKADMLNIFQVFA